MSTEWLRISPLTGKPVRQGNYKAGPGRGNHGPARPAETPRQVKPVGAKAPPSEPEPEPEPVSATLSIHFSGTAENAHSLLKAIYADTSLPLSVRMNAARIAIRHETPALPPSKTEVGPAAGFAERLERARKRVLAG